MASQEDIIRYLERANREVTLRELTEYFAENRTNVSRKIKQMNYYGVVTITVRKRVMYITKEG